jgi:glycosyltransferase involved in cell wall biosynthesis
MKVFEYLAAGRAILSSDLPVLREVLDERLAVMLPAGEIDAWQHALAELLANPSRGAELAEAAKAEAEKYSWRARARRALAGLEEDSGG